MAQSADVLDTWFSSALWPFATLGWPLACLQNQKYCKPKKNSDLERFYPTDVLSTDRGIINLWVARMIFSGMELMGKIPFKDVYIHATVLTREGKRMSKSLGTGINPTDLIEKYGADATRWGIAWQIRGGQDIRFVEDNIVMGRKFCNKLWNASRFLLLQFSNTKFPISNKFRIQNSKFTLADKKILKALNTTIKSVNKDLENFRFGPAAQKLYNFFWHDFCDLYIETSKFQIKKGKLEKERTKKILLYVLLTSLKLLHPFIPFITEEIYQKLPLKNKKECLMIEEWPTYLD
jgi:valyl-tRNA synthetase